MNQSTKDYISELSKVRNLTLADLVDVTKGGNNPGTWMHEDVAMEFARWLSPAFAIWCNDRIKELLTTGVTTTASDDQTILNAISILQGRIDEQSKRLDEANAKIEQDAPKVLFADAVSASNRSILIGELAKILKQNGVETGQNRLFEELRSEGYLCSKGERRNQPTQMSMEMGLFEMKKTSIQKSDGVVMVTTTTKVTPKGQQYFIKRYLER